MAASPKPALFYGWKLGILAAYGAFMIHGGAVYFMNTFIQPFQELYGWSRGDLGTALGIGSFCGMAAAPLFASLAMRVRLRPIMLGGALLGGITMFMFGRIANFHLFTLNLCLLWIAGQACGGVIANTLMSNWFIRHRGQAFGLVNFGMSFSGAVLPFVALVLLKVFSVSVATAVLGIVLLLTLVPGVWLLVRDTPESMGLLPDGNAPDKPARTKPATTAEAAAAQKNDAPPTIGELLRSPLMYRVGIAFALGILAAAGVVGQLKPRFSDLGYGDFAAMGLMCATAFFTACGKYVWGWVCDRCEPLLAAKILFLYCTGSYLLSFLPSHPITVGIFVLFCGLGMGGTWSVLPAVVADVFGRKHFIAAYRVVSLFIFFKSFGYIVMGQSYQLTGSYDAAFIMFSLFSLLGFFLMPRSGSKYVRP